MLQRDLLYTGVTAVRIVVLVGHKKALAIAVVEAGRVAGGRDPKMTTTCALSFCGL
jgi:hypothetical protein